MDNNLSFAITSDGSKTLYNPTIGEHYHSRHGALQESKHVFLDAGLKYFLQNGAREVRVLEVGFGTGLNYLVSAEYCNKEKISLSYTGIEAFPLDQDLISQTDYDRHLSPDVWDAFISNYKLALKGPSRISPISQLQISCNLLLDFQTNELFDVLYFDAFAAVHQPEMWNDEALSHISKFLRPGGIFVTYAITGN